MKASREPQKSAKIAIENHIIDQRSDAKPTSLAFSMKDAQRREINSDGFELRLTSSITANDADCTHGPKGNKKINRMKGAGRKDETRAQKKNFAAQDIRQRHKIYVWGDDIAYPCETFDRMLLKCSAAAGVKTVLQRNLEKFGFTLPTPIQIQAIPQMLQRREILACAPTGSGKTMAFVFPLVCYLCKETADSLGKIRAVIVEPTRELAHQVYHVVRRFGEGTPIRAHLARNLKTSRERLETEGTKHYDILISTPKRIVGLIRRKIIDLSAAHWLIVDESDKLFESGPGNMREQLAFIYKACDNMNLRRAFFSATFSFEVEEWCRLNLDNVVTICVGKRNSTAETVEQELKFVGDEYGKLVAIREMFRNGLEAPVLIFVQTKERAEQLFNELRAELPRVGVIHSGRNQEQRIEAVDKFRSGETLILICTELLGRGIDFKCVNVVINYDFPQSPIIYIHRIGRTGRAGRKGRAITLFTEDDKVLLRPIANVMKTSGCDVPDYLLAVPKPDKKLKRKLAKVGIKRKAINSTTKETKFSKPKKKRRNLTDERATR